MVIIEYKNTATQSIFDFGSGIFYSATTNLLEFEEVLSIVVADIFNHLVYAFHFRQERNLLHDSSASKQKRRMGRVFNKTCRTSKP